MNESASPEPNGNPDVVIVGGGPAGLWAAMYAGRGLLKTVLIERGLLGGELLNTELIEDYLGFESVLGRDLADKMSGHAKKFGAQFVFDTVDAIRRRDDGEFDVVTERGETYQAPAVIITAGGTPNKLRVDREEKIALPVATLIIIIFGAPLATSTKRGGTAFGIGMALLSTIVYMLLFRISGAVGETGALDPFTAAWLPNLVFLGGGLIFLSRVRT